MLEQQNPLLEHQEVHEQSLLLTEQKSILILQLNHLPDFFMIILNSMISFCPVDDQTTPILDIFKGLEAAMEIANKFWKFISSSLTDMTFIDDQH